MVIKYRISWESIIYYTDRGDLKDIKKVKICNKIFATRPFDTGAGESYFIELFTDIPGYKIDVALEDLILENYSVYLEEGTYYVGNKSGSNI